MAQNAVTLTLKAQSSCISRWAKATEKRSKTASSKQWTRKRDKPLKYKSKTLTTISFHNIWRNPGTWNALKSMTSWGREVLEGSSELLIVWTITSMRSRKSGFICLWTRTLRNTRSTERSRLLPSSTTKISWGTTLAGWSQCSSLRTSWIKLSNKFKPNIWRRVTTISPLFPPPNSTSHLCSSPSPN